MTPADWMAFVCGVDWLKYAREWLENGIDPELLYEMPVGRAYVLLFGAAEEKKVTSAADLKALRDQLIAKRKKGAT